MDDATPFPFDLPTVGGKKLTVSFAVSFAVTITQKLYREIARPAAEIGGDIGGCRFPYALT